MLLIQQEVNCDKMHLLQLKIIKNKIFKLLNGRMRTSIQSMHCNRSPPRIKHFRRKQNSPKFLLHNFFLKMLFISHAFFILNRELWNEQLACKLSFLNCI